jgi:hypothetical protein
MSERSNVRRAPRSGGRTAEQRSTHDTTRRTPVAGGTSDGGRGARQDRTQGTAALKLSPATAPSRVVEAEPRPRLRVAPPAPINVPRAPFIALVLVLVIAGVFGILLINTKTNENSFEIDKLQSQQADLDNEQQALERQLDSFESPGNIKARALTLGLVVGHPAIIRLPDGKIINLPVPGEGEVSRTAQGNDTQAPDDTKSTADQGAQNQGAQNQAAADQGTGTGVLPGAGQ